jgi:hypothetical protein
LRSTWLRTITFRKRSLAIAVARRPYGRHADDPALGKERKLNGHPPKLKTSTAVNGVPGVRMSFGKKVRAHQSAPPARAPASKPAHGPLIRIVGGGLAVVALLGSGLAYAHCATW